LRSSSTGHGRQVVVACAAGGALGFTRPRGYIVHIGRLGDRPHPGSSDEDVTDEQVVDEAADPWVAGKEKRLVKGTFPHVTPFGRGKVDTAVRGVGITPVGVPAGTGADDPVQVEPTTATA
jgi:hypothetical protein